MARKPGRPRAGADRLSHERIITAALAIVDAHGMAGLSMRHLAEQLGVDPMAIYGYLPGKQALLEAMVAAVFRQLLVETDAQASWQDQIRAFAHGYRSMARAHPNFVLYLVTDSDTAAGAAMAANETLYVALERAGLSLRSILHAADLIIDFLNGFALGERSGRIGQPGERQALRVQLAAQSEQHYPTMQRLVRTLSDQELVGDFEHELDILLAGIAAFSQR